MLQNHYSVFIFPKVPDFKLLQRFSVDADLALGSVHRVDMCSVVDVS
jgi:hypothetical protein